MRDCAKMRCQEPAVATVALRYGERVVFVGELETDPDPNLLDLCARHADLLTPPVGWRKVDGRDADGQARPGEAWLDRLS